MRMGIWVLVALAVLSLAAGCGRDDTTATALLTHTPRPADSLRPAATPDGPTPVCPPARGEGTIFPAISIYSVTFVVNGVEHVVRDGDTLQARPGEEVQVRAATICVGSFSGNGGEACVDVVPVDQSGQEIGSEHGGTHMVRVAPGFMSIAGPDQKWTIGENWRQFSVVLNHWPPDGTKDSGCSSGRCEHDDRIIIRFR